MPQLAPHLARELARGAAGTRIATTLDLPLQRAAEAVAAAALRDLPERASLALVVAELRGREVRALVGGDFGAAGRAGSLDLTRAVRSPGSALKPALYALAFEAGLAAPETLLADLPRRFGAYAPENFDRGFAGRITVADALRQSLNLPAVALLSELGPLPLRRGAEAGRRAAAAAAGGRPVAAAGARRDGDDAAGDGGALCRARRWRGGGGAAAGARAGRAAAPGLRAARRPAWPPPCWCSPSPMGGPPGIAWKTGTSWGGRDAWAMGLDARHVVGVWVGRPDGTPLPGATGARTALPILARLFERLPAAPREALPVRAAAAAGAEALDRLRLTFPPPGAVLGEGASPCDAARRRRPPAADLPGGRPAACRPSRPGARRPGRRPARASTG